MSTSCMDCTYKPEFNIEHQNNIVKMCGYCKAKDTSKYIGNAIVFIPNPGYEHVNSVVCSNDEKIYNVNLPCPLFRSI